MKFLKKITALFLIFSFAFLSQACLRKHEKERFAAYYFDYFDTATTIVGYEYNRADFDVVCNKIVSMLKEYHELYDIYSPYDGINNLYNVNEKDNNGHKEVEVDTRIIDLIEYSKDIYTLTNGYTNIAMGSVLSIWHDYREKGMEDPNNAEIPPMEMLKEAAEHTDIDSIKTNREKGTVFISDSETFIDVGAVAKGYAVEKIAQYLEDIGVSGYIINVGGNVRTIGLRDGVNGFTVGIENPDENDKSTYAEYLELKGEALVTSGSYQRYYYVRGKRYHHIIDPDTLMPENNFLSVSVLTSDSALGDALSTALFSMGLEEGMALIESMENAEAMWIDSDGNKFYSSAFSEHLINI